jgi:hypothetical protein
MPLPHIQRLFVSGTPLTPRTDRLVLHAFRYNTKPVISSPAIPGLLTFHPGSTVHPPQRPGYSTSPLLPMLLLLLLLLRPLMPCPPTLPLPWQFDWEAHVMQCKEAVEQVPSQTLRTQTESAVCIIFTKQSTARALPARLRGINASTDRGSWQAVAELARAKLLLQVTSATDSKS